MAIKMRVAKTFHYDHDGYVHAKLTISEGVRNVLVANGEKFGQGMEDRDLDCIEYVFLCEGGKELDFLVFNVTLRPDAIEQKRIGTKVIKIYNKYTTTLLKLGFITENELAKMRSEPYKDEDYEHILGELLAVRDMPVKFKPVRVKDKNKKKEYDTVDWLSLEVTGNETAIPVSNLSNPKRSRRVKEGDATDQE